MKYTVNLSPEAVKDINGIYEYIAIALDEKEIAVNMINLIEKSILSKFQSEDIPMDFHGLILEVVKYYNLIGEYDKAEAQLEKIN